MEREERVLGDLRGRAALEALPRGHAPELGLAERVPARGGRESHGVRERGGLPRQRRGGPRLSALRRGPNRLVVVLEREVLEVVLAQDADRVHEPLEHVLEGAAVAANLREHLEAVEGALALPDRLEVVRGLLEQAHAGDRRLAELRRVLALARAAGEVELHERRHVHALAAGLGVGLAMRPRGEPRPERARRVPVSPRFAEERGRGDPARLLGLVRGLGGEALRGEGPRAIHGRHLRQEGLRAAPLRGIVGRERLDDGQRPPGRVRPGQQVGERTEDRVVLPVRRVRARRGREERGDRAVHVAARGGRAGALAEDLNLFEHGPAGVTPWGGGCAALLRAAPRAARG